ncbi:Septin-domain-containing protein [Phycomyces nitens]|nr:Septin-domain-containing protein [Phycomyces nitens]
MHTPLGMPYTDRTNHSFQSEFGVQSLESDDERNMGPTQNHDSDRWSSQSPESQPTQWNCNFRSESNEDLIVPRLSLPHVMGAGFGYLRIIVCGDSGIGKSTLIQALLSSPEVLLLCGLSANSSMSLSSTLGPEDTEKCVSEYMASTMLSPEWEKNPSRERYRVYDDKIYTKNLCLVDTPGYGSSLQANDVIKPVVNYIEQQFVKTRTLLHPTLTDVDTVSHLVNNPYGAHSHVDCCLYLTLGHLKHVDIEYLRTIQPLCNIIPVIVKSDLLQPEDEKKLRIDVLQTLKHHNIHFFDFGHSFEDLLQHVLESDFSTPPFTLSNLTRLDWTGTENASISSSPDGINGDEEDSKLSADVRQLNHLKDCLFYSQTDALRFSTALKFSAWNQKQSPPAEQHSFGPSPYSSNRVEDFYAMRTNDIKNIELHIAHYVSEKRKEMEREMLEREQILRRDLKLANDAKRAEIVLRELGGLLHVQPSSFSYNPSKNGWLSIHSYWTVLMCAVSVAAGIALEAAFKGCISS